MLLESLKLVILVILIQTVKCDSNYRLNTTITPIAYALTITPYFDTENENAFTFDGEVNICFTTRENISQIKLHSDGLIFSASNITVTTGSTTVDLDESNPLEFVEKYDFANINLHTEIQAGLDYNLKIFYRGPISDGLDGFYRNYYIEKGVKKWLGSTHFAPTFARKAFPCFDEPELKAIFTLSIDRPKHYQPSLTNSKMQSTTSLSNGYIREVFYPTPKMPIYLVAFLISEFEAAASITEGSNEFSIYTRPEAKNQSQLAFDFGRRVVKALGEYFGIDYYSVSSNLKLDHVALIDFGAVAMENWGIIKYSEAWLLYDPEHSNPSYKYSITELVAHETTHMWFGNLVTCHWWSNIWLNEGFATYFQDYITALIEPEVGAANMLVIGSVYSAYNADDFPGSTPISNEVFSTDEIYGHFSTISYQKAGSVIRMMHHLMGDDAFKLGLRFYLEKNQFGSVDPEKLYAGLHHGATTYDALSMYPETNLADVMNSWITQAGYPVIQVTVNRVDFTVYLSQKRFYIDSIHQSDEIYKIPITYTLGNAPNFEDTKPGFIMHDKTHVFNISKASEPLNWIILNIQESGLYRVNYDTETWKLLTKVLKGGKSKEIHHLNRAKMVNDLFAFLYSDEVSFELLHEVLGFLTDETDYTVWYAAIRGFKKLRTTYVGTDILADIEKFALNLMENSIRRLDYIVAESDSLETERNRLQILDFACNLEHRRCLDNMTSLYNRLKEDGKEIPPSLRSVAYCTGLRYGSADDFEFLWDRMSTTNVANEAYVIGEILGCTSDESKLRSYLLSRLLDNSPIKTQDLMIPLKSVLYNHNNVNIVLDELSKNVTQWKTIYSSLGSVLSNIASAMHSETEFSNYESWLSNCAECGKEAIDAARQALVKARTLTSWADKHKDAIVMTLQNGYTSTVSC